MLSHEAYQDDLWNNNDISGEKILEAATNYDKITRGSELITKAKRKKMTDMDQSQQRDTESRNMERT